MGTLGCINDMMRRDKENRELRKAGKERLNETRNRLIDLNKKGHSSHLSLEQLEEIRIKTQEKGLSRFLAGIIFYTREVLLTSHYEKRLFEHASQPRVACADIRLLSYLWSRTNLSRDSYQSG